MDVSTGTVSMVREDAGVACGGRLNPDCSPVVGVISDQEQEGCVLAGVSLAHMGGRNGEVLRVCGDTVTSIFAEPLPVAPNGHRQTWPFTSLVALDDGWIAVSQYRFARSRHGAVTMGDVPPLHAWAGLQFSDPTDGVIFAEAACCWGSSNFIQYRMIVLPLEN